MERFKTTKLSISSIAVNTSNILSITPIEEFWLEKMIFNFVEKVKQVKISGQIQIN